MAEKFSYLPKTTHTKYFADCENRFKTRIVDPEILQHKHSPIANYGILSSLYAQVQSTSLLTLPTWTLYTNRDQLHSWSMFPRLHTLSTRRNKTHWKSKTGIGLLLSLLISLKWHTDKTQVSKTACLTTGKNKLRRQIIYIYKQREREWGERLHKSTSISCRMIHCFPIFGQAQNERAWK